MEENLANIFDTAFEELLTKNTAKGIHAVGISELIDEYSRLTHDSQEELDNSQHIWPIAGQVTGRTFRMIQQEPVVVNVPLSAVMIKLLQEAESRAFSSMEDPLFRICDEASTRN